jgi:hypothetical protein
MRSAILLVLTLFVMSGPALAQKVYIDYDRNYATDSIKTFGWKDTAATSLKEADPMLHDHIVSTIQRHLVGAGLSEEESAPDIWVTYHTSTKDNVSVNTSDYGYGYPGAWAWGGYYGHYGYAGVGYSTTTSVSTYQTGTLVVDVWDAKSNELVWRGTAANITIAENPGKMRSKIDRALEKIVNKSSKLRQKDKKKQPKAG